MTLKQIIKWALIALCAGLLFIVFFPKTYDVPSFKARKGTEYWHLNTGSKIGYTKVKADSISTKSPIIYLHGGPGGLIKDDIIHALKPLAKTGHDLYFYDQIGSGNSGRLDNIAEYSVERHKKDLAEIVEIINAEKVIIIGHSWGCMLAIQYLQDHPDKIEKIILEGPGPILPIDHSLRNQTPPDSLNLINPEYSNRAGNQKAYNWRTTIIRKFAYRFEKKLASDEEVDHFFTFLNNELNKSTNCTIKESKASSGGGGYYSHIMTAKSFDQVKNKKDQLKKLETPILILRGQCDNQSWGFTEEYLELFTNAHLEIIEGSGHDLINSTQEEYYTLVSAFLK